MGLRRGLGGLALRWFTGLGFDQEIPHHSTFSKNRHGRFQFEMERHVRQSCTEAARWVAIAAEADNAAELNP